MRDFQLDRKKWIIDKISWGWFIYFDPYENKSYIRYLHKDFKLSMFFGNENFFETKQEAEKHLNIYLTKFDFIEENEFIV